MEPNQQPVQQPQPPLQPNPQLPLQPGQTAPKILSQEIVQNKGNYFAKIFKGRMNRQNYSVGSLLLLIIPFIGFLIMLGGILSSPSNRSVLLVNPYDLNQLETSNLDASSIESTIQGIQNSPTFVVTNFLLGLYFIVTAPLVLAFQVRRLHDLGQSGWWLLINLVPLAAYVFPLYVTLASGTNGDNKYGPKPIPRTNIMEDILML